MTGDIFTVEDFIAGYGSDMWGGEAYRAAKELYKADAPLLMGTTGNRAVHYGGVLWWQVNTEANCFAVFDKDKWGGPNQEDGFRVITGFPTTKVTWVAEGGAKPDTVKNSYAQVFLTPQDATTGFEESKKSIRVGNRGQGISWQEVVAEMAVTHKKGLSENQALGGAALPGVKAIPFDRIISSYDEVTTCTNDYTAVAYSTDATTPDVYGIDRSSAAGWFDSNVLDNNGTVRTFTLTLLDQLIRTVAKACGIYQSIDYFMLCSHHTSEVINRLFQPIERHMMIEYGVKAVNGAKTYEGQNVGIYANHYRNVPIIPCDDIDDQSGGISPIFLINKKHLRLWMDHPTMFFEAGILSNTGPILLGKFNQEALYNTSYETWTNFFKAHGKLRDLKA